MGLTGWGFDILPADVNEAPINGEAPKDYVMRIAEAKGGAVARGSLPEGIIIAADTAVVDGEMILGKPFGLQEAFDMLQSLRGRMHKVFTALAVYDNDNFYS